VYPEWRETKIPGQGMVPCVLQFSLHKKIMELCMDVINIENNALCEQE